MRTWYRTGDGFPSALGQVIAIIGGSILAGLYLVG